MIPTLTKVRAATERSRADAQTAEATTRVGKDAGVMMVGDLVDRGLGFVYLVTATKIYGLEIYGAYLIALGIFQLVRTIVSFGLGRSLVKDAAAALALDDTQKLKGTIYLGFCLSLPLAILFGGGLILGAGELIATFLPTQTKVIEPLRVFGMLTPLFAFNFVLLQSLYGLGRIRDMVFANNVVEPVSRLAALLLLFGAGVSGYYAVPMAYAIALVVSSVFGLFIFLEKVWPRIRGVRAVMNVKEVLAFVIPITLNDLATRSFRTFNIAIFAVYRTAVDVSIFNVALKLTGVVFFFSGSLMSAFRPRISALLATGRNDLLSLEVRVFTRWILTFALLPFGLMIVFPADVLGLLGPQFLPAATTVRILCVGLLIAQAAGPLMTLLVMSGRSKESVGFLALGAITYTTLSILTVPRYGTEGAAWSGLATIAFYAPIISLYVQRALEIKLYGRRLVKPILAAILAFSVGWLVSLLLPSIAPDGPQLVRIARSASIVAIVAGGYIAILVKLGVEPEERAILANLRNPFSKLKRKLKKLFS